MPSKPQITLKSHRFRSEREESWKALETLLMRVEKSGMKGLSDADILNLPRLYRGALSSLSVARATSLDQSVIAYLESLSARAYYVLYGSQKSLGERILGFFVRDWPKAAQKALPDTLAATLFLLLGALVGYFLVQANPDWYYAFVDSNLAGERTPAASTESLRDTLYDNQDDGGFGVFAAFLFQNNSRVALLAFALGFAFCIPTIVLMLSTGLMLGGFVGLFSQRDLGFEVGGWLSIHGTTEIFAIILAGAGGLMIGRAVAFPGELSRMQSATKTGREAGVLLGGVVCMMFVAGLLEGFGRQLINSDFLRYGVGAVMLALWLFYFYAPRDFGGDGTQVPR